MGNFEFSIASGLSDRGKTHKNPRREGRGLEVLLNVVEVSACGLYFIRYLMIWAGICTRNSWLFQGQEKGVVSKAKALGR